MSKGMCMICKNRENQVIFCCTLVVKRTLIFICSQLTEFCSVKYSIFSEIRVSLERALVFFLGKLVMEGIASEFKSYYTYHELQSICSNLANIGLKGTKQLYKLKPQVGLSHLGS